MAVCGLSDLLPIITVIIIGITGVIISIAAFYAWKQFKESAKANKLTVFLELIKYLQDQEVRDARKTLIDLGESTKNYKQWTKYEEKQAEIALHAYNFAGLMEDMGLLKLIEENFVAKNYHHSIVKCWEAAEKWIMDKKKERGWDFLAEIEVLYKKAKEIDEEVKKQTVNI